MREQRAEVTGRAAGKGTDQRGWFLQTVLRDAVKRNPRWSGESLTLGYHVPLSHPPKVLCCISNSLTPHNRYVCERTNQQGPSVVDRGRPGPFCMQPCLQSLLSLPAPRHRVRQGLWISPLSPDPRQP